MREDAIFIGIEVDDRVAHDPEIAAKLVEVCPVDIYAQAQDGSLVIVDELIDECVLCQLCINAAPAGTVKVIKLYDEGAVLASDTAAA